MTQVRIRVYAGALAALTTLAYTLSARSAMPEQEPVDRNVAEVSPLAAVALRRSCALDAAAPRDP
jgi:hypothetical protein